MIVGLANKKCSIVNIQKVQNYQNIGGFQYFDTPLDSQTSAVRLMPNKNGYGIASVDGRANLTKISPDMNQMKFSQQSIMTFKCHKKGDGQQAVLYPVHDMVFHPNPMGKGFVSTVGGDGFMYFWDFE